ncbi:EMILIN-3 [Electrophorus electricus]|uniref:EMILIN-3 n=1 Tax=Electrophorus electricus TaxID=8005 RepID=UPI0015CF9B37|nr:EMILIN-3 [Electrophorus electricus]
MLWLGLFCPLILLGAGVAVTNAFGAFQPRPNHSSLFKSGPNPHYSSGKPTARHKNHCAYVVEKSMSYSVQDGAAPYVKAEYNKCGWGQKCPALMYQMFYKPMYKVAFKTVTELEWRCCPGFTGVACNVQPGAYGMKAMPPFKGPMSSNKGPQLFRKGPAPSYKGPMTSFKGPIPAFKGHTTHNDLGTPHKGIMPSHKEPVPLFKGPMIQPNYKQNFWNQPQTLFKRMGGYPGPNIAPSYPETSFEQYPDHEEAKPIHPVAMPEPHNPLTDDHDPGHNPIPDDHEPITDYQDPVRDTQGSSPQHPVTESVPETQAPSGDNEQNHDTEGDSVTVERLNRMEEEVRHLSFGLETLRGKVTGLEDHLRAALREDANRMLSALLSAAPVPVVTPPLDSTVAFGDLPGGAPDMEHADVVGQFPRLAELTEKVAELHAELKAKSSELAELRWMVLDHDGALQRLSGGWGNQTDSQDLETLVEAKLREARVAILGGFEKRVVSAEEHCEGQATEVRLQCKKELMEGREQLEQDLNGSVAGFREELRKLHSQLQGLEPTETCYSAVSGVTERLVLLEQSMDGLNQSQMHLQAELGGHKDHVEGMLEGRLGYVEAQLSLTEKQLGGVGSEMSGIRLDACLEDKMRALESRLFAAVEELSNATAPALLEGQSVPTLEAEVESLRKRVEVDMDRAQKQLSSLEVLCTSSCTSQPVLTGYDATLKQDETENHKNLHRKLEAQMERLDQLNATLNSLLIQLADTKVEEGLLGEVTLLKVSVHSVNRTLRGLKDSFGKVVQEVGRANLTWQEREERLAQQVKGVVHLVGQQASMLGAGERRLTRLRGELQDLRRRLGTELQGCRSTALGVRKEVTEVGGRVARVEDQCSGLARLAEDLELIRGELEKHMEGYLSQVNSTLVDHSVQLSVLRNGLRNCTVMSELTNTTDFTATQLWAETHTPEPAYPRGDQFIEPTQVEDVQELKYAP